MNDLKSIIGTPQPDRNEICETHGPYVSRNPFGKIWTQCPTCKKEYADKELARQEAVDKWNAEMQWSNKMKSSCIPDRFKDRELSKFEATTPAQQKALKFAIEYAESFDDVLSTGRSAVFIGKPGTGKTHLAIGIGLHIMKRRASVHFSTVMRAIRKIKDTWSNDSKMTETEAIKLFTFPDLLILDEVGIQFGSEFEKNIMFDIMNERYENRKPTILLSNLGIDEIKLYLGDRVFDRMREDGGKFIVFDWESWRGRK